MLSLFSIAFISQWWIRTRYPDWFRKYNYIVSAGVFLFSIPVYTVIYCEAPAGLDGGTQVMVFILSFAVQGAAGTSHLFPAWWGANQGGNYDRCMYLN